MSMMLPEHSSRMEEIETSITWMKLLEPHPDSEKKRLLLEMHAFGQIGDEMMTALFTLSKLGNVNG